MHKGIVVSFEDLERRVFADQMLCHAYLSVLIGQLRKNGWTITTHHRIGYKLEALPLDTATAAR